MAKQVALWLQTTEGGNPRSGLRDDLGDDANGLCVNVDETTVGLVGNRIVAGPGALPAAGGTVNPPTSTDHVQVAVDLARVSGARRAGIVEVASDPSDIANPANALALNPDWETAVVGYYTNSLTVLAPPALTRGYGGYIYNPSPGSPAHPIALGTSDTPCPQSRDNYHYAPFLVGGVYHYPADEWHLTTDPASADFLRVIVPETGRYVWTLSDLPFEVQFGTTPFDTSTFGTTCTVTMTVRANSTVLGTLAVDFVAPPYWRGDLTPYAFSEQAKGTGTLSGMSDLTAGQEITVTGRYSAPETCVVYIGSISPVDPFQRFLIQGVA